MRHVERRAIRRWLALVVTVAALQGSPAASQETGAAATVNGVEISNFRLERYFDDFLKERGRNLGTLRNPQAYKRLKREALERLIDRELLVQEASRRGIEVPTEEVVAVRARLAASYKSREAFQFRLGDAGFDEAGFDRYVRHDMMAQRALATLIEEAARSSVASSASAAGGAEAPAAPRSRGAIESEVLLKLRQSAAIKRLVAL